MKENVVLPEGVAFSVGMVAEEDDPRIDQARKMGQACVGVTDSDRCEAAFKIFECTKAYAAANGIDVQLY